MDRTVGFWERFSGVNLTIRVICAAWFLALVLIGGAGRMLLNASGAAWEWLVPPAAVQALAGPDPVAAPLAGNGSAGQAAPATAIMVGESASEAEQRAAKAGWGPGQALPAAGTADGAAHF